MCKLSRLLSIGSVVLLAPCAALAQQQPTQQDREVSAAQQNVPAPVQKAEANVERQVKRWAIGVQGGVGLDPEIVDVGVHASIGPIFSPNLRFRPVLEIGLGEITTILGINLDFLYTFPGYTGETQWIPYLGGGPNFGLSHRGFETEDSDNVDAEVNGEDVDETGGRFDFSDTDFNGGMNFIVGMRKQNGVFIEMKATAWGVSNIRLLAGFNF
jgi:hypothetical protein